MKNNLIGKHIEWENQHIKFQGVVIGTLQNGFIAVRILKPNLNGSVIFIFRILKK